jgi:hypothetical protein
MDTIRIAFRKESGSENRAAIRPIIMYKGCPGLSAMPNVYAAVSVCAEWLFVMRISENRYTQHAPIQRRNPIPF